MGSDPMSRQEAENWITRNPLTNQSKFWKEANKLGPGSVPGMIEVLSDGPADLQAQAAIVLTRNGVSVSRNGDEVNPDWVLILADGETRTITPHHRIEPDANDNPWGESPPTLNAAAMRKLLAMYALLFVIAAGLAVGAYATDGVVQVILGVIAGVIVAVTLWSAVFMTVARHFQKGVQRLDADGE